MTGTKWRDLREKRITNKQPCERLDNIESFDEIYDHHCLNWFIKLAIMPATESENCLPRNSLVLGAPLAIVFAVPSYKTPITPTLIY